MKRILVMAVSLGLALTAVAQDQKPVQKPKKDVMPKEMVYKVDPTASKVEWTGKKIAGPHNGTVGIKEGKFEINSKGIAKGEVIVDLNTIVNEDVKDPEWNGKLVGHLKSEDFFDVAKHPTAVFKVESFQEMMNIKEGEPNAIAKGKLTIRGVTKPYETKLFYTNTNDSVTFKGKIEIDRTQYGLKYNSKKFFDPKALGDKLIDDKFEVSLNIVAKK